MVDDENGSKGTFSCSAGVVSLLFSAGRRDEGIVYLLSGDLCQMSTQEQYLANQGMNLGHNDVYPGFKTQEEYLEAIRLIWQNRIEGWWNYERELVKAGICTQNEFDGRFKKN